MEVIKVFNENEPEYRKLKVAAAMMEYMDPERKMFRAANTYFDFGQNWMWTTILAESDSIFCDGWYQALYPSTQETILKAETIEEIAVAVEQFFAERKEREMRAL